MKFLTVLLFLCFLQCSYAGTFYISPTGNDETGTGSISNPWKTLYKAALAVTTAGDIIHVNAGTYTETKQIVLAVGVSIEGDGVSSVIKSTITTDWTEILSLHSPEGTNGNQHISNLKFDGQNLSTFWAIYVAGRSNVSINNCTIVDFKDRGVIFGGRMDNQEAPPDMYATGNSFHNNTVLNCAAYNTANGIYGRGCLNIGGQEGMLIYNNTITQNQRPEGYNGWPIKLFNDGNLKGCKIYNNILTKIPYKGIFPGDSGWDFCSELFNVSGLEIYGNHIQGSLDFNNQTKGTYSYSVWIHDNTFFQPTLNSSFESGIILESASEAVIIENNKFNNISGCVLFYTRDLNYVNDITIRNNLFLNIGKKTGNGNNGTGIGIYSESTNNYAISNLNIYNNTIIAANGNAPYYGIEIAGAASATGIKIQNNTIQDFRVTAVFANPAFVINTLSIEKNTFSGNGNNNKPFYIRGTPADYTFKNNIKKISPTGSTPGFYFKQQLIRPLYYEVKNMSLLEYIAFFSFFIFLWFSSKENIYALPAGLIYTAISLFISFEGSLPGVATVNIYFTALCIYGWVIWSKRDHRHHRILRVHSSTKKELFSQLAFFSFSFIIISITLFYFRKHFKPDLIPWADAFICASAFTGLWFMIQKKVESWYWWIATCAISVPTYFVKHYLFISGYYLFILMMAVWGLYQWKKRRVKRRKS